MKTPIVFVGAMRTPFGSFGGSLRGVSATELAVHAARAATAGLLSVNDQIDHVIFGNVIQSSADAAYLSRHVALKLGLPEVTPALTVNRLCGSGFEAAILGANLLKLNEARAVLVGGAENMSACPYVIRSARFGNKAGHSELEDSLMSGLFDTYAGMPMALTAERLAEQYHLDRTACDAFALQSQTRAAYAQKSGWLAAEISPYVLSDRGKEKRVEHDEHIRPDSSMEGLTRLKAVFKKEGVVTAGNASGMVDGAAALVMTTAAHAQSKKWQPLGEFLGSAVVGCDPKIMGIGPVTAIRKLLAATGTQLSDYKQIEINEAFAAQTLAVCQALELPADRINPNGGAISIGHPLGASGARIITQLLHSLKRQGGGMGLGSACIGGGQGIAVAVRV